MAKRKWVFDIDGKPHEVQLKFGLITGRQIWLDGNVINKGRNTFEMGSEYFFSVDGHSAELGIVSTAMGYEYYLRIDKEFVFPKGDTHKKIGKATAKRLDEHQKWVELGKKYGLQYRPIPKKSFVQQHRLIGYVRNFLVLIAFGYIKSGDNSVPGFFMYIRHSPIDSEKAKEVIGIEEVKKISVETKIPLHLLEINTEHTSLFANAGFWKTEESKALERLFSFFDVISKTLKPTMADKCEGSECKSPYYKDLMLTLINGIPLAMCQDCIDQIDDIGRKAEEEYKKQPDNLLTGTLYGLVATFLGAIVWALIQIFLDRIGAIFAIFNFFLIVKAMDYAKTKRTFKSLFIAAALSLAGSVIGTYIGFAGYLFREGEFEIKLSEFIWLAKKIIDNPDLISDTIFFSLIGLVPYLFITWNANRGNLKRFFKPEVELIKNFELKR